MVNENSLKQLSSFLQSLQTKKPVVPLTVEFYLRKEQYDRGKFMLVKIPLRSRDIRTTVLAILKACELPTTFVEKIPAPKIKISNDNSNPFSKINENIFDIEILHRQIKVKKDDITLRSWLERNVENARSLQTAGKPVRDEIEKLKTNLCKSLHLNDVKWECGWNVSHFRACLQALQALSVHYPDEMKILKKRTLIFAPFTGVSMEGDVLLNSGEVRHNWLDLIKTVGDHDAVLLRIPAFEKAVSQVLLDIKVGRRKFMPKVMASDYEKHLRSIITSINDFKTYNRFPKSWPKSLIDYEIVVETEAGPLMLSPTGQFIVPSSCPGFLLINFIADNLNEATSRLATYKKHKHIEKKLHSEVLIKLKLAKLEKDDSVTPDLMISCCERLLNNSDQLHKQLYDLPLHITTYYSIMTDGVVCIPWNWNL